MKKLVILVLVFGVASLASAAIELALNGVTTPGDGVGESGQPVPSANLTVSVYSNDNLNYNAWIEVVGPMSGFTVPNGVVHAAAGGDAFIADYSRPNFLFMDATDFATGPTPNAEHFSWDLHCEGEGDVLVNLYDGNNALVDTLTVSQIPEPMTMALLGLGGLFLRRRK